MKNGKPFVQMIEYQQILFDNTFRLVDLFHDQGEKMIHLSIDQNPWLPEDGKKICSYWTETYQKQTKNFKGFMDTNFNKVKEIFSGPEETAKAS